LRCKNKTLFSIAPIFDQNLPEIYNFSTLFKTLQILKHPAI
jgi:hypothetical protein